MFERSDNEFKVNYYTGKCKDAVICWMNTPRKVAIVVSYRPPDGSVFANPNFIYQLEKDLDDFSEMHGEMDTVYLGDFNGRMSNTDPPESQIFTGIPQICGNWTDTDSDDAPKRCSKDNTTNKYGMELVEYLIRQELFLLNGREGFGDECGNFTFASSQGCSVIDYAFCSSGIIPHISDFQVNELALSSHFPLVLE